MRRFGWYDVIFDDDETLQLKLSGTNHGSSWRLETPQDARLNAHSPKGARRDGSDGCVVHPRVHPGAGYGSMTPCASH